MLLTLLISLLMTATLALLVVGGLLIRQQRIERAERRVAAEDPVIVTLGDVVPEVTEIDRHALAKLQLELQARQQLADIIG